MTALDAGAGAGWRGASACAWERQRRPAASFSTNGSGLARLVTAAGTGSTWKCQWSMSIVFAAYPRRKTLPHDPAGYHFCPLSESEQRRSPAVWRPLH